MFGIPLFDLSWLIIGLLAAGAVTGLLAGLFGVGGGAVAIPLLYELFRLMEVPEEVRCRFASERRWPSSFRPRCALSPRTGPRARST
jgi:hypothetical protein